MTLVPLLLTSCSDFTANSCTVFAMFLDTVTHSAMSTTATFNSLETYHIRGNYRTVRLSNYGQKNAAITEPPWTLNDIPR